MNTNKISRLLIFIFLGLFFYFWLGKETIYKIFKLEFTIDSKEILLFILGLFIGLITVYLSSSYEKSIK